MSRHYACSSLRARIRHEVQGTGDRYSGVLTHELQSGLLVHKRRMMFRKGRFEIHAKRELLDVQAAGRPVPVGAEKAKEAMKR